VGTALENFDDEPDVAVEVAAALVDGNVDSSCRHEHALEDEDLLA
jgi:hypothetical protein